MANLDFTIKVLNIGEEEATGIIVSIPTPVELGFDTVVTGSGYSDVTKRWTIDSIPVGQSSSIILRYQNIVNTSNLINLNVVILTARGVVITPNGNSVISSVYNPGLLTGVLTTTPVEGAAGYDMDITVSSSIVPIYCELTAGGVFSTFIIDSSPKTKRLVNMATPTGLCDVKLGIILDNWVDGKVIIPYG